MTEAIAGVEIPQTTAAVEATRAVRGTTSQLIFDHSRRVFLFGAMQAQARGMEPDPELLYLAALYHDTGLATPYSEKEQRFEIDGADHARKFLLDQGFPARSAETVWTAIALHTTPGIPDRLGPEIAGTARGVLTDVVGLGLEDLDPVQVDEVIAAHPRGDF
jgi:HD superfamily phosphodiesterase